MKLVNPAGRNISTFKTEAYSACNCLCSSGSSSANKVGRRGDTGCGCNCQSDNYANRTANSSGAYDA